MANRYIAFGYEITDGRVSIIKNEQNVIENIFGMYINGLSLSEISNRMNSAGISYNNDGRNWNKNIIKRILENRKYLGEDEYPQIVPEDTFVMATRIKDKKVIRATGKEKELTTILRDNLICGCCGKKISRYNGTRTKDRRVAHFRCINPECESPATSINEKDLNMGIATILNSIIRNYEDAVSDENVPPDLSETEIMENEIRADIIEEKASIKDIVEKIMHIAEQRFELCPDQDLTSVDDMIKRELSIRAEMDEIDINLLKKIMKSIKLHQDKLIEIELINGKSIIGGEKNDRCSI